MSLTFEILQWRRLIAKLLHHKEEEEANSTDKCKLNWRTELVFVSLTLVCSLRRNGKTLLKLTWLAFANLNNNYSLISFSSSAFPFHWAAALLILIKWREKILKETALSSIDVDEDTTVATATMMANKRR